ncbi:ubiquitin carboxyl-terminal hydrolase 9 isoform X2 [Fopius arisanus]|uniref:ubiquitinyl hydrolase 1 n=1 Tax=Fopius arisanus TaxID=64838 RepID=A0A9R1TAE1_9HYME|nr:PREDICTED: ubiquitin carboxyl-terminal hydrolase 9-like isoform X2 [Fopius arisanus]
MDNQVGGSGVGEISMIESSGLADLSDIPELLESESTSLSPLANSLNHHLAIQDDKDCTAHVNMGIETTWAAANCSRSDVVSVAIPLPPPEALDGSMVNIGAEPARENAGADHGPFYPPTSTLNNLFSNTTDIQEHTVIEIATPAGVCGLRNLGNTCFMAAGLQCLTATPPVLSYFLQMQQGDEKSPLPGSLMDNFSSLLSKMWSGRYSVVRPVEFKQTLGAYHSQFKDYRQHDCQEFLALLLDSLHEQMNTAKSNKSCQMSPSTAITANSLSMSKNCDNLASTFDAIVTASSKSNDDLMDTYSQSPSSDCQNSPNITMAGSPRDLDSPMDDLDSVANSPSGSLLHDDEETLDSEELLDSKLSFIYNKTHNEEHSMYEFVGLMELSKKSNHYTKFIDIVKDAKTSNANFLVTPQECNNEIHYDSQKFPKDNLRRMALDNSNLTENHDFDNKNLSIKRIKEVNVQKTNINDCLSAESDTECESASEKCNVKRMRLEDHQKNRKRDGLGTSGILFLRTMQNCDNGAVAAQDEAEANEHWAKHLKWNKSVIVDTFQGQFKSTVVCAVCKHISVTYEPFMYLSVPLPHAMERQLTITYIPVTNEPPIRCVVSLNKQSKIGKVKEELLNTLQKDDIPTSNLALAEVLENHISKILDDNLLLRYVKDMSRSIYAFELTALPDVYTSTNESGIDYSRETDPCQNVTSAEDEIGPCTICLEELDGDLMKHGGKSCSFIMCETCIENYFKTQKGPRTCPVCSAYVEPSSFMKVGQTGKPRPTVRILNVPVILRYDTNSDEAPNNQKRTELCGYPHLVRLPSRVYAKSLYEVFKKIVPQEDHYTIHFVDGQGHHCSRCMYNTHCTGCPVPETGMISLQTSDTLAIRYTENVPKTPLPRDHASVRKQRPPHPLSLYDCLQAFTQSERLDEHNPWFCPKCERNQCATKTLTVHRYPKFVFHECVSMKLDDKVTFPLVGLSVGRHLYDLYACVCHFGGVSAGHYTAYTKNPRTDCWHHYNDEITSRQKPQEEDFSNAYILFYNRQGANSKPCNI